METSADYTFAKAEWACDVYSLNLVSVKNAADLTKLQAASSIIGNEYYLIVHVGIVPWA